MPFVHDFANVAGNIIKTLSHIDEMKYTIRDEMSEVSNDLAVANFLRVVKGDKKRLYTIFCTVDTEFICQKIIYKKGPQIFTPRYRGITSSNSEKSYYALV